MHRTRRTRTARTGSSRPTPRSTSAFAPDQWHVAASGTVNARLSTDDFCVPEGVVRVIRCPQCGGRDEHLTLYPRGASDEDAVRGGRIASERQAAFAARHHLCATQPIGFRQPGTVTAFAHYLVTEATAILRMGDSVQQAAYVMCDSGMVEFDYPSSPPGHTNATATRIALAELHSAIRRFIREHALSVQAIAHLGACWVSEDPRATLGTLGAKSAPDRTEALAVTVVTPTDGRILYLPLASVSDDRLAGRLSVPRWHVLSQRAPMIDGLLATTTWATPADHAAP